MPARAEFGFSFESIESKRILIFFLNERRQAVKKCGRFPNREAVSGLERTFRSEKWVDHLGSGNGQKRPDRGGHGQGFQVGFSAGPNVV